jgi:hypothetical protein
MSKKGILSIFIYSTDRAQGFHPLIFCGSLFKSVKAIEAADLIQIETLI